MPLATNEESLDSLAAAARSAARASAGLSSSARDVALVSMQKALEEAREEIEEANALDKKNAVTANLGMPLLKRLDLCGAKFDSMLRKIDEVKALADPVGQVSMATELDKDLCLYRVSTPIGVVAVIFESRPEAAVQIASLAIKSANALILKGGKEAVNTNAALVRAMQKGLRGSATIPAEAVQLVSSREEVGALLKMVGSIDLVVPRGSNQLVQDIMARTRIPVMGHADGICHVYLDESANPEAAVGIVVDSKTDYPVACNAMECLLVNRKALVDVWPLVAGALLRAGVELRADDDCIAALNAASGGAETALLSESLLLRATEEDYRCEFGRLAMAVKCVDSVEEAVAHVNSYGSHHTDAIVAEDHRALEHFLKYVDSAGVYANASTRFADGQRYGFGAEVGVSTNRIHSRGPMGVEGLMIYKYVLQGRGHTVSELNSSGRGFLHRQLPLVLPPPPCDSVPPRSAATADASSGGGVCPLHALFNRRVALELVAVSTAAVIGALYGMRKCR